MPGGRDCIILDRKDLESYLGLEKFREERLDWICRDVKPIFPYVELLYDIDKKFDGIALSRLDFEMLPLPVRSEEDFLSNPASNSKFAVLLNLDDAEYRKFLEKNRDNDEEWYPEVLEKFTTYADESLVEKIQLSGKGGRLYVGAEPFTEEKVLKALSFGFAGLDDSVAYQ